MKHAMSLMLCVCVGAGSAVLLAGAPAGDAPAAGVKVTPVSIEERRSKQLVKTRTFGMPPELTLALHVTGPAAAKAKRAGHVRITKALDDKGNSLLPKKRSFGSRMRDGYKTVNEYMRHGVKDGFKLDLSLAQSQRAATKISSLTGSFKLLTGEKVADGTIPDVKSLEGKDAAHPVLAAAGLKVKIVKASGGFMGGGPRAISYVPGGNTDALVDVELVDSAGKEIQSSSGSVRMGSGPRTYHVEAMGKLPPKAGLKLKVLTGAKSTTVPLELKDIPLP